MKPDLRFVQTPLAKPWEHITRAHDGVSEIVFWRIINRHSWYEQPFTLACEADLGEEVVIHALLTRSRAFIHRLKTAGPAGRLP